MSAVVARRLILVAIPLVTLAVLGIWLGPIQQPPTFYEYADRRTVIGIANFNDVVSNLAFLLSGLAGFVHCLKHRPVGALRAWSVFFAGVTMVSLGSAYYHLDPRAGTLIWDRLPITIGFMAAYAALIAEYVDRRLEMPVLLPALLAGAASVAYWVAVNDLAPYFAVQATVFLSGFWLLLAFDSPFFQKRFVAVAFLIYFVAIACEQLDHQIFTLTAAMVSGHTLKHLFAALAIYWIYRMLARRTSPAPSLG